MVVKPVVPKVPQIKLICLPNEVITIDEIAEELVRSNDSQQDESLKMIRDFAIRTPNSSYRRLIFSVDLELHDKILSDGYLLFFNRKRRVFENVVWIQCFHCQGYGDFARTCTLAAACRICSEEHAVKDGANVNKPPKCINCIALVAKGEQVSVVHQSTDDRCEVYGT